MHERIPVKIANLIEDLKNFLVGIRRFQVLNTGPPLYAVHCLSHELHVVLPQYVFRRTHRVKASSRWKLERKAASSFSKVFFRLVSNRC